MTNVSVVIVNYNSGRFLELCVNSVCRSDCLLEIIVVDNASTDGSTDCLANLMASDVPLQVIRNEENRGFSAAINRGVGDSNFRGNKFASKAHDSNRINANFVAYNENLLGTRV